MKRWYSWSLQRRVLVTSGVLVTVMIVIGVAAFAVALDRILFSASLDAARAKAEQVSQLVSSGESPATEVVAEVPVQGSIAQVLGTPDFVRMRVGVGRPGRGDPRDVADFVLSPFEAHEDRDGIVARAADAVEVVVAEGLAEAQRRFNERS